MKNTYILNEGNTHRLLQESEDDETPTVSVLCERGDSSRACGKRSIFPEGKGKEVEGKLNTVFATNACTPPCRGAQFIDFVSLTTNFYKTFKFLFIKPCIICCFVLIFLCYSHPFQAKDLVKYEWEGTLLQLLLIEGRIGNPITTSRT